MCSAVSGICARAPLQSPQRWLCSKVTLQNRDSSTSSSFFQASRAFASSHSLQSNIFGVEGVSPRTRRLRPSSVAARVHLGGARTSSTSHIQTTGRAATSRGDRFLSPCSHGVSFFPLTPTFPMLSAMSSSRRLLASKTPAPSSSPSSPTAPQTPSQQLPVQAREQQVLDKVEKRHGDELKNFYHMPSGHHGDPRHHISPDGTLRFQTTAESFHWENDGADTPAQQIVSVNGKKMIKGVETRDFVELFQIYQKNVPFWPRTRISAWGNHDLLMKAEFLFFWIPTFIIWSLAVPMFTMLYMSDEAIYSAMTVKVIGRQWYWIYEIESPVEEEEE